MDTTDKPVISQKEYLKKYFSKSKGGKTKKKRLKLSSSSHVKRSQIIDDDLNLNAVANVDDEEFNLSYLGDEAPQIAGIVDERPDHIKALEYYGDTKKWKSILDEPSGDASPNISSQPLDSKNQPDPQNRKQIASSLNWDKREHLKRKEIIVEKESGSDEFTCTKKTFSKNSSGNKYSSGEQTLPRKAITDNKYLKQSNTSRKNGSGKDNMYSKLDSDSDVSPHMKATKFNKYRKQDSDSDQSPLKKASMKLDKCQKRDSDRGRSPPRKATKNGKYRKNLDGDQSPPRKTASKLDKYRRQNSDSDQSPPKKNPSKLDKCRRQNSDSDQSPSRKSAPKLDKCRRQNSDSDQSPSRKSAPKLDKYRRQNSDSDQSPPKKSAPKLYKYRRQNSDSDQSPPRKIASKLDKYRRQNSDSDQSPPRKSAPKLDKYRRQNSDSDQSPPRKSAPKLDKYRKQNSDCDQSPPRKTSKNVQHIDGGRYNPRINRPEERQHLQNQTRDKWKNDHLSDRSNKSPQTSKEKYAHSSRIRNQSPDYLSGKFKNKDNIRNNLPGLQKDVSKMQKTLEGKKAGLQDAKNLRDELASLRDQEDKMFKSMDSSKYGIGREAVVRDRKTGRIKDFEKEKEESREKMQERLAREQKYSKWGKGLKQLEDASARVVDTLHEMAKPLARYKNDSDLDTFLKAQEREGDPMLDFIRKKQNESHSVEKLKPRYEGSFAPNRFNIRPGHRWDGVDRSNGYEAKWFENINAKKAIQEEAYRWSSADM